MARLFPGKPLVSERELGKALGKSPMTMWRWRMSGEMPPSVKTPGSSDGTRGALFYWVEDLEDWFRVRTKKRNQRAMDRK